jgi:hypothetical protein
MSTAYAPRTQAREKLMLQVGRPVTIALEFSTGKLVQSPRGGPDQVYYTLTDGRCWYADLEAAEMIERLDLVSREPFTVCKLGAGRFEVQRAGHYPTAPVRGGAPVHTSAPHAGLGGEPVREYSQPTPQRVNGEGESAAQILAGCYPDAVDVVLAGLAACKAKGLMVAPTFEDIRCIATALFIQQTGGRR